MAIQPVPQSCGHLLDGRAFTATELAIAANTSPQNISMHLGKLLDANLLCVEKQGRHKYYRFSNKEVAYAVEAMANLVPKPEVSIKKEIGRLSSNKILQNLL